MNGTTVVIVTLLVIASIFLIVWGSFALLENFNELYNDTPIDEHQGLKIILLIPYLVLAIWCIVLQVLIALITVGLLIDAAHSARDWWHRK